MQMQLHLHGSAAELVAFSQPSSHPDSSSSSSSSSSRCWPVHTAKATFASASSSRPPQFGCSCSTTTTSSTFGTTRCKSRSIPIMVDDSRTKLPTPAHAPADAQAKTPREGDDHDDESTRKRIASIATRFGGLAAQASSRATQKATDAASQATEQVSKTVSPTAAQTAGVLQAMALSTKNVFSPAERAKEAKSCHRLPARPRHLVCKAGSRLAECAHLGLFRLLFLFQLVRWQQVGYRTAARLPRAAFARWLAGVRLDVWGKGDQLGTINLLTESLVLRAAKQEIQTGRTVSLNWPIHLPAEPFFARRAVTHKPFGKGGRGYTAPRDAYVASVRTKNPDVVVVDDPAVPISDEVLELNTQSGSQWDGLRHYGHLPLSVFYGGASRASIHDSFNDTSPQPADPEAWNTQQAKARNALGIHHLAQHGICGRGVLLDVFEYLSHHGTEGVQREQYDWSKWSKYGGGKGYDPRSGFRITVADLEATAKHQGVELRRGDILLVRSGFTARYYSLSSEERAAWSNPNPKEGMGMPFAGVEQSDDMKRFMWNHHFAAVAGDSPAFEARPTRKGETMLHETLLAMWGMPIGELFDLEALAHTCKQLGRYSFYFSSWPLNLFGGVASTANASATF
ncbi:hypothetical protein L1887_51727 [Cichorium endivia]|nr:hypothetical protein L1887_51727 [Cichorium endivia]